MKITKKELPKNQAELKIEIEPKEYQEFLEKTAQKMSENSKIKGFRPGKAPYDLLKAQFGKMKILETALNDILTHFYFEAIVKEKLEPISHPQIDMEKMAVGNPLIFKATINLIPSIKLCDLDKIKVKKSEIKIKEDEINKAIETLRENQAKEVLEDKKIEKNDKVDIDFTISVDGVPIEGGKETNYPLVVGRGHMIPGFEENLISKKKGDKQMVVRYIQLGKQGITENFLESLKTQFQNSRTVKVSVLPSARESKEDVKKYSKELLEKLGAHYTSKIIGFTITLKKWRKARE